MNSWEEGASLPDAEVETGETLTFSGRSLCAQKVDISTQSSTGHAALVPFDLNWNSIKFIILPSLTISDQDHVPDRAGRCRTLAPIKII
jgi:hypothetical protein